MFCSPECRHRGERRPDRRPVNREEVERLFDPSRDPDERVKMDDWFPSNDLGARDVYSSETVAGRRRWYIRLLEEGLL